MSPLLHVFLVKGVLMLFIAVLTRAWDLSVEFKLIVDRRRDHNSVLRTIRKGLNLLFGANLDLNLGHIKAIYLDTLHSASKIFILYYLLKRLMGSQVLGPFERVFI